MHLAKNFRQNYANYSPYYFNTLSFLVVTAVFRSNYSVSLVSQKISIPRITFRSNHPNRRAIRT